MIESYRNRVNIYGTGIRVPCSQKIRDQIDETPEKQTSQSEEMSEMYSKTDSSMRNRIELQTFKT